MADYDNRCWAVINLDNIAKNIEALRKNMRPGCLFMAAVKADAYGHGDLQVSLELERLKVDRFGVSCFDEAVYLRENGVTKPILVLGPTKPAKAPELFRRGCIQTVHSESYAAALNNVCVKNNIKIPVHIKIDTGMSRLGFDCGDEQGILAAYFSEGFYPEGIFTHFASADEFTPEAEDYTRKQFAHFLGIIKKLEAKGAAFKIRHCCNSAATIRFPEMHLDMVRPGIAIYGLNPAAYFANQIELSPAMELYSRVTCVREVKAGTAVSYGRIFTAPKDMTIASVGVGYADGYPRALSNKGRMLLNGQYAGVIGRVCMDQIMLDATHIAGVHEGSIVTVVGRIGENSLSLDEMAGASDTINYERACLIGKRVPRVYLREGLYVSLRDYINRK